MNVSDYKPFNQIDPGTMQAAIPEIPSGAGLTPAGYFWLAVSAGVTVWFITRALDRAIPKRR